MLFTPKAARSLAPVSLVLAVLLSGCEQQSLDSPEYGEIIRQVPRELNRPYPLPELDGPQAAPLPGPTPESDETPKNPE